MLRLLLPAFLLLATINARGQCPGCTPDSSCTVNPAYPTLCPLQPPDATAGVPYQADLTFWLPPTFTDPGTGFTVDFEQMTITGITGIPFGLSIETSDPLGVYYPQQAQYGCARICGTALGAGTYSITIDILAQVSVNGLQVSVPESFAVLLNVLPGTGGNTGFSFTPGTGCAPVTVTYTALIDGSPDPTTYDWDFGGGQTATGANPPPVTYAQPGSYTTTLTTTIGGHTLDAVSLVSVNDNWCGDVEEPDVPLVGCTGSPDLYFVLTDGNGQQVTSGTQDDTDNATWSALGLPLNDGPYSIAFFDEDPVSQDDALGTWNIPLNGAGTYPFSIANGTVGSLVVSTSVQQVFQDTDTVVVHAVPDMTLAYDTLNGTLCLGDSSLVSVLWFLNGDTLPGTGPCIQTAGAGSYWAAGINGFGCTATSDTVVVCPAIAIAYNGGVLFTENGFATYAWTYNGTVLPNADGAFVFSQGDGLYTVTVTTSDGCTVEASLDLITTGLVEPVGGAVLRVFPVPSDGRFTLVAQGLAGGPCDLRLVDLGGRTVAERTLSLVPGHPAEVDLRGAPMGSYVLEVVDKAGVRGVQRVVVR
ncbi:MAG: hypothetical protein IT228_04370 [Flavobacteriales bacterium]|nr:hypothetical protein [Flavobacteriales bacterium]MCC6576558.1 hypothetical protein [Flavobacteriales bacterium]NUQ15670.1 hypothetical protein [Flavobacteriales bacterium]